MYRYPENYSPTEYMTHEQWEKWTEVTKEIMAKLPSGWIFIPRMRMKDGKIMVELEERKLVTCKDCVHHHYDSHNIPYCDNIDYGYGWKDDDFCSKGEKRDATD